MHLGGLLIRGRAGVLARVGKEYEVTMHPPFQRSRLLVGFASVIAACGAEKLDGAAESSGESTAAQTSASGSTSTTGSSSGSSASSADSTSGGPSSSSGVDSGDETSPAPIFDVGSVGDLPPAREGCRNVDFLFVIDDSSSMAAYQLNLVANFPAFISGIQDTLDTADSYQVGVVTTDVYQFNSPECSQLSSLVVETGGVSSSNMACGPYADGYNFMTENDDLVESFSCAASVGVSGDGNERPMQAMVEAAQGLDGGPGQCNEGFIREDSLLVIVIIGDEYDNSPGIPMEWYDDVVEAKLGYPENVVVVSIIDVPGSACGGASVEVAAFTALWGENGFLVPICGGDYGPFFEEAIGVIGEACENYTSPAG